MISVRLNGTEFIGWSQASVRASVKEATRSFSITMAENSLDPDQPYWAAPGDAVEILADGVKIFTGFVNDYMPEFSGSQHTVTITGRDKVQDCVDCSAIHPSGRFTGKTPEQIANELTAQFGVGVKMEADQTTVERFQLNQGETVYHALDRLARAQGMTITSNEDGDLVFTTASSAGHPTLLQEGAWPLLSARATISDRGRFSDYKARVQIGSSDSRFGVDAASGRAEVQDPVVTRFRPKLFIMESAQDSQSATKRVDFQARRAAGKSTKIDAQVQGHSADGEIWRPNRRVMVSSRFLKVSTRMLIESVTFEQGEGGSTTSLSLVPPSTYGGKKTRSRTRSPAAPEADDPFVGVEPSRFPTPDEVALPQVTIEKPTVGPQ